MLQGEQRQALWVFQDKTSVQRTVLTPSLFPRELPEMGDAVPPIPVPGRATSPLLLLLICIICVLIYSAEGQRAWKGWWLLFFFVMLCLVWLPSPAGVFHVCVCDISGLKSTRDWVGGKGERNLSFTKLDAIIILAVSLGKASEMDFFFFCHTFVFSITERGETFPLAEQQPCPRGTWL